MRSLAGSIGIALMAAAIGGCNTGPSAPTPVDNTVDPATPQYYTRNVRPIFEKYCFRCHAGINHRGGLSMATHASMMKGGKTGVDIVPGDPEASLMMRLLRHQGTSHDPENMPSKSSKLADQDIATVERWIHAGALMPPDPPRP
jgi:mono/diheme cytochrome c family protein